MKSGEEFRREFPQVDRRFEDAARRTLAALRDEKQHGHVVRAVLMTAGLVLLIATIAVAANAVRWNAADFIEGNMYSNMNSSAREVLAEHAIDVRMDTPFAQMTLKQAVYDGMAVYLLFEAHPMQAGQLIAAGAVLDEENDQAFSHGSRYPTDISIHEYAAQQGYAGTQLIEVFGDEITACVFDSAMNDDGSCSLMVWAFVRPEYRELEDLALHLRLLDASHRTQNPSEESRYEVTLPLAGGTRIHACNDVVALPQVGIEVNGITAVTTPMTTYILLDYDVTERSAYSAAMFYGGGITLADSNGDALEKGTHPLSLVVDRSVQRMGEGTYYITSRQMPADADVILLKLNGENVHTFHLK